MVSQVAVEVVNLSFTFILFYFILFNAIIGFRGGRSSFGAPQGPPAEVLG